MNIYIYICHICIYIHIYIYIYLYLSMCVCVCVCVYRYQEDLGGVGPPVEEEQPQLPLLPTGNSNSHGARPVHLIITMIKWFRTSRLSIKNSLSCPHQATPGQLSGLVESRATIQGYLAHKKTSPLGPYSRPTPRTLR